MRTISTYAARAGAAAVAAVLLSACVNNDLERAGIGAAVGTGAAIVLDANPVAGAVAGGAAGALCDDLTNLC